MDSNSTKTNKMKNSQSIIGKLIYKIKESFVSYLSVISLVIIWQLSVDLFKIPTFVLPSPLRAIQALFHYWPAIWDNLSTTLFEILVGFSATILISIPLATLISYSKILERTIYPFMVLLQLIPKVAIAPLFAIWFGFGVTPKIMMVFLLSFFPLLIDTTVGLKSLNLRLIYLSKSMSKSEWKLFWKIKLPNALPQVFSGLKVSISSATVGAIVGEFLGSNSGLGSLLLRANGDYNTPLLFAILIVLSVMGIVFYKTVEFIERGLIPWHSSQRRDLFLAKNNC